MPTGTQKEYAAWRKCSQPAVSQAIKDGRLSLSLIPKGKRFLIDFEIADQEWAANSGYSDNPNLAPPELHHTPPIEIPSAIVNDDLPQVSDVAKNLASDEEPISFAVARARTEHFKAKTAELVFRKQAGELVERSDIARVAFEVATTAKNKSFSRAPRLAQVALEAPDEKAAIAAVKAELRTVFDELADACEGMGADD
jgi:hypothetical protein